MATCVWCGSKFERRSLRGPVPKYCSDAHRQAAHRARHTQKMDPAIFEGLAPKIDPAIFEGLIPKIDPAIFEGLIPKIDPAIFEGLIPKIDPSLLDRLASSIEVASISIALPERIDDLTGEARLQAMAVAVVVIVVLIALSRELGEASVALAESLWAIWVLQWQLQNSSPAGALVVDVAWLALGLGMRHITRSGPNSPPE